MGTYGAANRGAGYRAGHAAQPVLHHDEIADTIDYGKIVARIREILAEKSFRLVEAMAETVAQMIMAEFGTPWVKVRVAKPGILPGVKQLGVVIERGSKI